MLGGGGGTSMTRRLEPFIVELAALAFVLALPLSVISAFAPAGGFTALSVFSALSPTVAFTTLSLFSAVCGFALDEFFATVLLSPRVPDPSDRLVVTLAVLIVVTAPLSFASVALCEDSNVPATQAKTSAHRCSLPFTLSFKLCTNRSYIWALTLPFGYSLAMGNKSNFSVIFLGDIIGKPGRQLVVKYVTEQLASPEPPDVVIANVENAAHGFGVTESILTELSEAGIKIFSGGNHTFDKKEIFDFIDRYPTLLRPANYPDGTPGKGSCVLDVDGFKFGVLNLMGRIFMEPLQSPYHTADALLPALIEECDAVLVDLHAEATAEKVSMGWYLNGKVAAVVGTHTHIQTADERVLPGGTAYITDVGSCGPADGVIGMDKESVFRRMVQQLPARLDVADGAVQLNGVRIEISRQTGKATSISRVFIRDEFNES